MPRVICLVKPGVNLDQYRHPRVIPRGPPTTMSFGATAAAGKSMRGLEKRFTYLLTTHSVG